ncbi:ABC transporter substrate-binding protein [Streptomyces cinnamoneus]|uniref:Extracellular small neutral protease n=1 Tax=Streptomyces cinnamoneus TaxID=53446 RepID=A0A2G1XG75_STRCJ|nr:snapalysin [Streptomyces cinnamoneus]PHQ50205.1 ABC transporter substrate-binding protein [Streptomyces cinnamoneus]PPT13011.1 ABC transporter substrate-binding protein [Streptomyces cinnamoneus]
MKRSTMVLSAALGLGLAASLTAVPASAATQAPAGTSSARTVSSYVGSAAEEANNKAFFDAVMKSVKAKQAAAPGAQVVTVVYDASQAPSFQTEIANSARIWNSSVRNVQLRAGSNADFRYYEGNDSRGSYASTDGHGRGYVFLDYQQNEQYDSTRVTAHETGHVLGLPDHYSGPCSELMSGGGPGPSCTNAYPNTTERSRINQLWANGLKAFDKDAFTKAR